MINRHSSSLSISTLFHIFILAIFLNIDFTQKKPDEDEKRIAVYMCTFEQEKAKEEAKKIEQPPKEIKQTQPKLTQKIQKATPVQPIKEISAKTVESSQDNSLPILQNTTKDVSIPTQQTHADTQESFDVCQSKKESSSYNDDYLALNKDAIYAIIKDNLYYPMSARKRGIEGLVVIKFIINKNAEISNIEIKESSSNILSKALIQTIEELSKKFPSPAEQITITLPIEYKLN